ncbi:ankyrin repeat domain-containing protein [Candidatus Dependentiae bacterium]
MKSNALNNKLRSILEGRAIKSVFANKPSPRLRPTGASTDATPFIPESKIRSIQAKRKRKLLCAILAISITCNVLASSSHNSNWSIYNALKTMKNNTYQVLKSIKSKIFGAKKPTLWEKTKHGATTLARTITSKKGLLVTGAISLLAATMFALKKIFWSRSSDSGKDNPKPDPKSPGINKHKPDNKPPKLHPKDPKKSTQKGKAKLSKLSKIYKKITGKAKKLFDKHHFNKKLFICCKTDDLEGAKEAIESGAQVTVELLDIPFFSHTLNSDSNVHVNYSIFSHPLDVAIESNSLKVVKYLLSQNQRPLTHTPLDRHLFHACANGNLEMVMILVENGADVNYTYKRNRPILVELIKNIVHGNILSSPQFDCETKDYRKECKKIIEYLISHGADIYFEDPCALFVNKRLRSPIEEAKYLDSLYSRETTKTLLNAHYQKMYQNMENSKRPLVFYNLKLNNKKCALCEQTIDKNDTNLVVLWPCGHIAHKNCLKNRFESGEDTCSYCQQRVRRIELFHKARWFLDENSETPLHDIVKNDIPLNDLTFALEFFHGNIDINKQDENGYSALDIALGHENTNLKVPHIRLLMKHGAKPYKDIDKHFLKYCKHGRFDIINYLVEIKNGANIHATDGEGKSGLDKALEEAHFEIVQYLTQEDVQVKKNENMEKYLFIACQKGKLNLVKLLVQHYKVDLNAKIPFYETDEKLYSALDIALTNSQNVVIKYLIKKKVPIYGFTKEEHLFRALNNYDLPGDTIIEIMFYVTQDVLDLRIKNHNHQSILDVLLKRFNYSESFMNIIRPFLQANAIIYYAPKNYIVRAIEHGKLEIVKYLVKAGLNIDDWIKQNGEEKEIVELSKDLNKQEITKHLDKLIVNQNVLFRKERDLHNYLTHKKYKEINKPERRQKLVKEIKTLILDTNTPPYAIQKVLPTIFKIHETYPQLVASYELRNFLKRIPFNNEEFLLLPEFQKIRNFAAKYFIMGRNNPIYVKDSFNLTIDDACIIYLKGTDSIDTIDHVISHKFSNTNWFRTSKAQLMRWLNTGNTQNNNLLEKLDYAKKMKNKKFYQNLLNMAYLKCMLVKDRIPSEITSHIVSFLPKKELGKIGDKILKRNKKLIKD